MAAELGVTGSISWRGRTEEKPLAQVIELMNHGDLFEEILRKRKFNEAETKKVLLQVRSLSEISVKITEHFMSLSCFSMIYARCGMRFKDKRRRRFQCVKFSH